jgi:predicted acyltransferase
VLCVLANPTDPFSLQGYFGIGVDKAILGEAHMYKGEGVSFDPEGITSTLTSIVQVIFGYFVGNYIQQKGKTYDMLTHLFVAGSLLVFAGFAWDMTFPINKKIWTSSFVLYTTGLAVYHLIASSSSSLNLKKYTSKNGSSHPLCKARSALGRRPYYSLAGKQVITEAPYISVALCMLIVDRHYTHAAQQQLEQIL